MAGARSFRTEPRDSEIIRGEPGALPVSGFRSRISDVQGGLDPCGIEPRIPRRCRGAVQILPVLLRARFSQTARTHAGKDRAANVALLRTALRRLQLEQVPELAERLRHERKRGRRRALSLELRRVSASGGFCKTVRRTGEPADPPGATLIY